ncbi:VOC family protein [Devosia sp. A16]|uniref:VOC family protein n=1 Tax=Devosia sp. A16 TaxID=1736675 RepID=UPI0006D83F0A|nr:VOC family protein [Devosia sp. A16]
MPGFIHVDIGADDPQRAADFYRRVFGWKVRKLDGPVPYWLLVPPAGAGGGIARREQPWQTAIPTIDVASAEQAARLVVEQGGEIIVPNTTIPGVGKLFTFRDTEGNVLSAVELALGDAPAPTG